MISQPPPFNIPQHQTSTILHTINSASIVRQYSITCAHGCVVHVDSLSSHVAIFRCNCIGDNGSAFMLDLHSGNRLELPNNVDAKMIILPSLQNEPQKNTPPIDQNSPQLLSMQWNSEDIFTELYSPPSYASPTRMMSVTLSGKQVISSHNNYLIARDLDFNKFMCVYECDGDSITRVSGAIPQKDLPDYYSFENDKIALYNFSENTGTLSMKVIDFDRNAQQPPPLRTLTLPRFSKPTMPFPHCACCSKWTSTPTISRDKDIGLALFSIAVRGDFVYAPVPSPHTGGGSLPHHLRYIGLQVTSPTTTITTFKVIQGYKRYSHVIIRISKRGDMQCDFHLRVWRRQLCLLPTSNIKVFLWAL